VGVFSSIDRIDEKNVRKIYELSVCCGQLHKGVSEMNRIIKISLLLLVMALVSGFTVVTRKAPSALDVHIVDVHDIDGGTGDFTASGSAVDTDAMCPSGDVEDINVKVYDTPNGIYEILMVTKKFTCDDASGTFDVKMVVRLDLATHETIAAWRFTGGTGDYASLRGFGKLVGTPIDPGESITDVYDGKIR
jgi:hypothetical protein